MLLGISLIMDKSRIRASRNYRLTIFSYEYDLTLFRKHVSSLQHPHEVPRTTSGLADTVNGGFLSG